MIHVHAHIQIQRDIDDRQMTFDPFCRSQGFKAILRGPLQSHYSWWPISTRNL